MNDSTTHKQRDAMISKYPDSEARHPWSGHNGVVLQDILKSILVETVHFQNILTGTGI